ncbi:MAG: fimbrillin family protein [Bacteroidaceae bacterium]|nr:fimbrillin family protein [Bacteroidaceae bacterium]
MKLHNFASRCLCLLTGVALLTACDNETDFADPNNRDGKPLRIETSIAETRAVVTSTNFAEGDRVGLFVLDDGGQYYADNAMNQPATYNASGWSMENEIVLSKEKTPYVFAVYPYYGSADYIPVDINMRMSINIAPNQYEGIEGQADWMYANALPLEGNTAKLTFRHALARVTLQLKRGADETGDGLLTKVRMQNAMKYDDNNAEQGRGTDLCTTGWMSLRNGSINTEETKNAESYIEQTTEMGLSAEAQTIDFLVIPTALPGQTNTPDANTTGGGIEVLLTIDGKQYRVDLGVPTWHAGQQYIYPITINRNSAEVTPELTPTEGEYVDLGLPSGTLWASCNVGANSPEEAGGYYAWGETDEKEDYSWGTYNWGTGTSFTKYCTDSSYGTVDGKTTLEPEDDVAYMVLGSEWRMPTQTEVQELQEYCTWTLGEYKGCAGYLIEGSNGNCIFLPFAGAIYDNERHYESEGYYWTATLRETTSGIFNYFNTNSKYYNLGYQRYYGMTVRPIYDPQPTEEAGEAVDLGLSVKWASFNVGATKPEEYGGYYAWGETEEKEKYSTSTSLTYNLSYSELQSRGIISGDGNLTASYDVAAIKWGGNWRMPTSVEIQELIEICTWTLTELNGINGYKVLGPNSNSIFLPAAGVFNPSSLNYVGESGFYWSSTSNSDDCFAHGFHFYSENYGINRNSWCNTGHSVRPVTK